MNPQIALTGGIACGKTLAESCLKKAGILFSVDTDEVCHRIYRKLPDAAARKMRDVWGAEVVSPDGKVDRTALSQAVFSAENTAPALALLHEIIHPEINREVTHMINDYRNAGGSGPVLVVVPLLYEYGMQNDYDRIISVWCDRETQVTRLMRRNGFTRAEAQKRIDAQMSADQKLERADFGLINTGTPDALLRQCIELVRQIHEIYQ